MRKLALTLALSLLVVSVGHTGSPDWAMNATTIEACTCPMFCQCYFNTEPAAHHEHGSKTHYCKFNMAYKINKGHHGSVNLDGVKFWVAGDLGSDYSQGLTDWAVVTFDKSTTSEQRQALAEILPHLFPVKWTSFKTAEGVVDTWEAGADSAYATLDGGKSGEIRLKRFAGMTADPVVVQNLRYWGAPRNEGFVLMPNEVQAYRVGDKAFESRGTNGFMITVDLGSQDMQGDKGM